MNIEYKVPIVAQNIVESSWFQNTSVDGPSIRPLTIKRQHAKELETHVL